MTISRRSLLTALAALTPGLAFAQSADDPVATVREFYAVANENTDLRFFTAGLKRLFERQRRRARELDSPLPGLDTDYLCNCQEEQDNWKTTLRFDQIARAGTVARVRVRFHNFEDREAVFTLNRENGRWLIDDIRHQNGTPWQDLLRRQD